MMLLSQLAVEKLNLDKSLLQGSELTFMLNDTAVSTTTGASLAASFIARDAVGIIGGEQSSVSEAIASISQTRNVMQLSYQASDGRLADKELFPLFGRVATLPHSCLKVSRWVSGGRTHAQDPKPDAGSILGAV